MNDDCRPCPKELRRDIRCDFGSAGAHFRDGGRLGQKGWLSGLRRAADRCGSAGRWVGLWRAARIRRWWSGHRRWRGCGSMRRRDCRPYKGADRLVPDAAGPVLSGVGAGRSPFRSCNLCRERPGGRCPRQYGGGAVLWGIGRRGWRAGAIADGKLTAPAVGGRADRHYGARGAALATPDRGERLWPADRFDDPLEGECPAVGRIAGPWSWTGAMVSRIDAGKGGRVC